MRIKNLMNKEQVIISLSRSQNLILQWFLILLLKILLQWFLLKVKLERELAG